MIGSEAPIIAGRAPSDRLALQVSEAGRRLDLRASVLFARHVCETRLAAEHVDSHIAALCRPIERLGANALCALRAIPDSRELVEADQSLLATHSLPPDRERHEVAVEMGRLAAPLLEYLRRNRDRIDGNLDQFTSF
jgi:hypothetical protein